MDLYESEYLAHYGILRRSGRYPWGSGGNVPTRSKRFLDYVEEQKQLGFTEAEIAEAHKMSTTELRDLRTIARNEIKQAEFLEAQKLRDKGMSPTAIAEKMGKPESSVRLLLSQREKYDQNILQNTADTIQKLVDSSQAGLVDIGKGAENYLNISKEKLRAALTMLKEKGYEVHTVPVEQAATNFNTETKVICKPGMTQHDAFLARTEIAPITAFTNDNGSTFTHTQPPISVNPDRLAINYGPDGGDTADGVIYVRPGVSDLSLGSNQYAQVRIKVGDSHYLKGMAVYKDDLPDGVDLVFNTNKTDTGNKLDPLKPLLDSADYPFGTVVRQLNGPDGKPYSAMNIVNEEGNWETWKNTLASQVLSKQSHSLARKQLDARYEARQREFDEIMALTNPVLKKTLLEKFSEAADSSAVDLEAARLPRQTWSVILPVNTLKENEIFAPGYNDGETVALIRYPHGGNFEIPELTVNNRNAEGRKLIGPGSRAAVGIHHKTAQWLSGADFDGDTVLVIPNNNRQIKTRPKLKQLENFDPQRDYAGYEGMPKLTDKYKQRLMGEVSNLITDMTLQGAPTEELARAVKHSMVVIDAEKHDLDWRRSQRENGIQELRNKYQLKPDGGSGGASTLLSRSTAKVRVEDRKLRPASQGGHIDPKTGELIYVPSGKTRTTKTGERVPRLTKVKRGELTSDAYSLVSTANTEMERIYADHSNRLKSLANKARLESIKTPPLKQSQSAKVVYAEQTKSLRRKLTAAQMNAPRERQAQVQARQAMDALKQVDPTLKKDTYKKVYNQKLMEARDRLGARKPKIEFTPEEWDAVQAGAISTTMLKQLLANANMEQVKQLATPRPAAPKMSPAKTARAQAMLKSGATRAEVAAALGVSLSTLDLATVGEDWKV